MVLEGAVVEGLVAVAEVGGEQIAGGAATDEAAVRAHPRVVAAEAGEPGRHAGLRVGLDVEGADGPGGPVELLHADVADPRRTGEGDAGGGEQEPRSPTFEHLDDADLAVGPRSHHQLRRRRLGVGRTLVADDDRVRRP